MQSLLLEMFSDSSTEGAKSVHFPKSEIQMYAGQTRLGTSLIWKSVMSTYVTLFDGGTDSKQH